MMGGAERCLSDNKTHPNSWNHSRLGWSIKGPRISSARPRCLLKLRARADAEQNRSSAHPPYQIRAQSLLKIPGKRHVLEVTESDPMKRPLQLSQRASSKHRLSFSQHSASTSPIGPAGPHTSNINFSKPVTHLYNGDNPTICQLNLIYNTHKKCLCIHSFT